MLRHAAAALVMAMPLAVLDAEPAEADGGRHRHHGYHHYWHGHGHHQRHNSASIVFWSGPVYRPYYARPPVVYVPPPPPVVYAPPPAQVVYAPSVNAVPTRDFQDGEGRYCREYQRTAIIDGREQQVYGTACLMPDGAWRIVSE
jgi:hypothetical protein